MTDFSVYRETAREGRHRDRGFTIKDASGKIVWRGYGFSPPTVDGDYREWAVEIALRALKGERPKHANPELLTAKQGQIVADWQARVWGKAA